jgi:hypothetical protein
MPSTMSMGTCTSWFSRFEVLVVAQGTIMVGNLYYRGFFRVDRKSKKANFLGTGIFPLRCGGGVENHLFSFVCLYSYYICIYIQICHIDMSIVFTPPPQRGWYIDINQHYQITVICCLSKMFIMLVTNLCQRICDELRFANERAKASYKQESSVLRSTVLNRNLGPIEPSTGPCGRLSFPSLARMRVA